VMIDIDQNDQIKLVFEEAKQPEEPEAVA